MGCDCNGGMMNGGPILDWTDWQNAPPRSPFALIANATLDAAQGTFARQIVTADPWIPNVMKYANEATCVALEDDNHLMVANAAQWNFRHQTVNLAPSLAPPLQQVVFLRGGTQWRMEMPIDFGGEGGITDVTLTFRDNYATRGDAQGTIPLLTFASGGPLTGTHLLSVTLNYKPGRVFMGLVGKSGPARMMFAMEWIIVP